MRVWYNSIEILLPVWCAEARIDKDYVEAENIAEHIEITFNTKLGLSPKFLVTSVTRSEVSVL